MTRHRRDIAARLALDQLPVDRSLPARVRAVVVVDRLDRPTVRALGYARAQRGGPVEAVVVDLDPAATAELRRRWLAADLDVPLVELAAPLGDRSSAVAEHVRALHREEPGCLVSVYLVEVSGAGRRDTGPTRLLGGLRDRLLGGPQRRLRRELLALPSTVVATVPWRLDGSEPDRPQAEDDSSRSTAS